MSILLVKRLLCYYLKHLMMCSDGRFARHPRFRYIVLNTEMHRRALQAGRVYIQHPEDARLFVDELCDMVSTTFSPAMSVTTLVLSGEHVPNG